MGPGVCPVKSYIDRNIADDLDPMVIGVILQLFPLLCENQLGELMLADLIRQLFIIPSDCVRTPHSDPVLPLAPLCIIKMLPQGHIKAVI